MLRNRIVSIIIVTGSLLSFGCASKQTAKMLGSGVAPAAEGEMTLAKADNENTRMNLGVKHLAMPKSISEDATVYVVWARPTFSTNSASQNMGALRLNDDLEAELSTILPHRNFTVFVTAEPSNLVVSPSRHRVLELTLPRLAE